MGCCHNGSCDECCPPGGVIESLTPPRTAVYGDEAERRKVLKAKKLELAKEECALDGHKWDQCDGSAIVSGTTLTFGDKVECSNCYAIGKIIIVEDKAP